MITFGGAPHLGFSIDPTQARFNSLSLVDGDWPSANEVVIDRSTASKKNIHVGDTIRIEAQGSAQPFKVSGLVKFGTSNLDIGGATLAGFDLPTAQSLFGKEGKLDQIRVAKKSGVSEADLLQQIRAILPPQTQVRSGVAQAETDASDTNSFTNFLQKFLLSFGFIALFVGAFVIANSLSITITQRTREFATLRTLGASRRQILRSVLLESFVIGVTASVIGLFLGLALAKLLFWLFGQFGFTLPNTGLLFKSRTVIFSLVVGIVVTMIASVRPARRATRVPPIAAVREGATLPPGRFARYRPVGSAVLAVLGFLSLAYGMFGAQRHERRSSLFMGLGALLVFFGVALFSSQLVRPLAAVLGVPGDRLAGAPGVLARENATRNPQRTGSTAAALMIGLALVTLVTMLATSIRASFFGAVDKIFDRRLRGHGGEQLRPDPDRDRQTSCGRRPASTTSSASASARHAHLRRTKHSVSAIDPGGEPDLQAGLDGRLAADARHARPDGAFTDKDFAKNHNLTLGSKCAAARPERRAADVHDQGHLRPAVGRLAVRRPLMISSRHLRQALHAPAGPVRLLQRRRRRLEGEQREARPGAEGLPEREGPEPRRVQEEPGELPQEHPQHPLRAARALRDRQPVRDRQHARADDLRADARARDAARGRDDALAGAVDDRRWRASSRR